MNSNNIELINSTTGPASEIKSISVFEIDDKYNVRAGFDQDRVKYFVNLLKSREKLPPIKVCFYNNSWVCLDGHMELQAFKELNILYVECEIINDVPASQFLLYSAKFNLVSSKPLTQEEITKIIIDSHYGKNISIDIIKEILGVGRRYIYKILQPYRKKMLQDTIKKVLELYHDGNNFHTVDEIAAIVGYDFRTVTRWINQFENPLLEYKKLFDNLKTQSSKVFIDKELNTFLSIQLIKRNMNINDICELLKIQPRNVFIIGYTILYCYQNRECSIDDIAEHFDNNNKEQMLMIHFMSVYFLNLLVERGPLYDWLEANCELHDEKFRKLVHIEMLYRITEENNNSVDITDNVKKRGRNKTVKYGDIIGEQLDVLNPNQLAVVVDKLKLIEDEYVINKKSIDSDNAKKILEQLNRLMAMMNSIMPVLVKSINFK